MAFNLGKVPGDVDQLGQGGLRVLILLGGVGFGTLDIDPQGSALGAGAGQAIDDACAALKQQADALSSAAAAVYRVGVAEIIALFKWVIAEALPDQAAGARA